MKHSLSTLSGLVIANFLCIWLFDVGVDRAIERSFFQAVAIYSVYMNNRREDNHVHH